MLINTKHIVMFDDAASDFGRIAHMVDTDGSVLIIKDGRPAYAVVPFDEVQEADRPASGATPKVTTEPTCACGKPQSQCGCGGHGGGGCGGHGRHGGHGHAGHGAAHAHGHAHPAPHFGHGSDAGHLHDDTYEPGNATWFEEAASDGDEDWSVRFEAGEGFGPLFHRDPNFSVDEFISRMPPEMVEAGKRFVSQLNPLIGLFGNLGTTNTRVDEPGNEN